MSDSDCPCPRCALARMARDLADFARQAPGLAAVATASAAIRDAQAELAGSGPMSDATDAACVAANDAMVRVARLIDLDAEGEA